MTANERLMRIAGGAVITALMLLWLIFGALMNAGA